MRKSLDTWDKIPDDMRYYLKHHGYHFSKKMAEWAIGKMKKMGASGKPEKIAKITLEQLEDIMRRHGVDLEEGVTYDALYVWHMGYADYLGSSIVDEKHLAMYVKDTIEDKDGYEGLVFNRWYADMCKKGYDIYWEDYV